MLYPWRGFGVGDGSASAAPSAVRRMPPPLGGVRPGSVAVWIATGCSPGVWLGEKDRGKELSEHLVFILVEKKILGTHDSNDTHKISVLCTSRCTQCCWMKTSGPLPRDRSLPHPAEETTPVFLDSQMVVEHKAICSFFLPSFLRRGSALQWCHPQRGLCLFQPPGARWPTGRHTSKALAARWLFALPNHSNSLLSLTSLEAGLLARYLTTKHRACMVEFGVQIWCGQIFEDYFRKIADHENCLLWDIFLHVQK